MFAGVLLVVVVVEWVVGTVFVEKLVERVGVEVW